MKKKMNTCALIALSIIPVWLVSCSSSKVILESSYADQRIAEATLTVRLIDDTPYINYRGDVGPEFGEGNTHHLIMEFFKKQLPQDILHATTFKTVSFEESVPDIHWDSREVSIWKPGIFFKSKRRLNVKVPAQRSRLGKDGDGADFELVLDNLQIGTDFKHTAPTMGANGMMMGGSVSKNLNYISDFSIWDNREGELVSVGHIEKSASNIFPVITMSTWERVSSSYVRGLFNRSPFRR